MKQRLFIFQRQDILKNCRNNCGRASIQTHDIKTEPKLNGVDLLFIVGGIYASKSDPKMIAYIEKMDKNKCNSQ